MNCNFKPSSCNVFQRPCCEDTRVSDYFFPDLALNGLYLVASSKKLCVSGKPGQKERATFHEYKVVGPYSKVYLLYDSYFSNRTYFFGTVMYHNTAFKRAAETFVYGVSGKLRRKSSHNHNRRRYSSLSGKGLTFKVPNGDAEKTPLIGKNNKKR